MRKIHVVRKQGYFKVNVAQNWTLPSVPCRFRSFENAYRYFRYHVSFLGWNYGTLIFVDKLHEPIELYAVDRGE